MEQSIQNKNMIYYYLVYLKSLKEPDKLELHLIPFYTKENALKYKEGADKKFGDRVVKSKILTRDLNKYDNEFWL